MKIRDLERKVEKILPGATLDKDNQGQVVIYTGVMETEDHDLIPFELDCDWHSNYITCENCYVEG